MKKINKFMFIVPNTRLFGKRYWLWFNPAIFTLVPILRKFGIDVEILEANIDNLNQEQMKQRIKQYVPDMVGISNMSLEYWKQAHVAAQIAKEVDPEIITVMGGVHATTLPEKILEDQNFDYVILSEGEERLPKFIEILQSHNHDFSKMDGIGYRQDGRIVIHKPLKFIDNIDSLPMTDYTILRSDQVTKVMNGQQRSVVGLGTRLAPVATVMTSRGCRFRCCFCAGSMLSGHRARLRSAESVLAEIDMLVKNYNIRELIFTDDEMYCDMERAKKIIQGIKDRKYNLIWKNTNQAAWLMDFELMKLMKESGCYQITISPESGNNRVLKEIIHKPGNKEQCHNVVKWCKELDIEIEADFVIGFPGETWEEIRDTTNFADELDADAVKFAIATPFPGTELFEKAVEKGCLPRDFEWYRDDMLGFAHGVINTEHFTVRELEMLRCYEWDRINFKNQSKKERYARMNMMTLEELEEFRKATRRSMGVYFLDQVKDERDVSDEVITGRDKSGAEAVRQRIGSYSSGQMS